MATHNSGTEVYNFAIGIFNQELAALNNFLRELEKMYKMSAEQKAMTENFIRSLDHYSDRLDQKTMRFFMDEIAKPDYDSIREPILQGLKDFIQTHQNLKQ